MTTTHGEITLFRPAIRGVVDDVCHVLGVNRDEVMSVLIMSATVVVRFADDTIKTYRW